jgi:hypothetical protein
MEQEIEDAYWRWWREKGSVPREIVIATENRWDITDVHNIVSRPEFVRKMRRRGIEITDDWQLSSEQWRAICHVTDTSKKGSIQTKLRDIGIPWELWRSWNVNPVFRENYEALANEILQHSLSDINAGLVKRATSGDVNAIKFFYELTGRYRPGQNDANQNVMSVLVQVVEIIQKHVRDPEVLNKIAMDFGAFGVYATQKGAITSGTVQQ